MQDRPKISPKNIQSQSQEKASYDDKTDNNETTEDGKEKQDNIISVPYCKEPIDPQQKNIVGNFVKPRPKLSNLKPYNGIIQTEKVDEAERKIGNQLLRPTKRKLKFEDKYHRLSTFLENELYDKVIDLKERGYIDSIVQLVNDSIKQYLNIK